MSISQSLSIPDNFTPKSFWEKPEGKTGMILVAAVTVIGGFYAWGKVVPFILSTIQSTFWLSIYGVGLFILFDLLFGITSIGKAFRTIVKNVLQSTARALTSIFVTIDPIGILQNTLDDLKKERVTLGEATEQFTGTEEMLQRKIETRRGEIDRFGNIARISEQRSTATTNVLEKQKWLLERQTNLEKAGILMSSLKKTEGLLSQVSNTLRTFQSWIQVADSKITKTEFVVEYLADERKTILQTKKTLNVGKRLLRGNDEQEQQFDMAIEYLAEDTAQTLGQMREFTRFTDKMVTEDQLESAAAAESAAARFEEFNQKLLNAASEKSVVDMIHIPGITNTRFVPATDSFSRSSMARDNAAPKNFDDMFK